MKKKILTFIVFVMLLCTTFMSISVMADEKVSVMVDGITLQFDVEPRIMDGRTMVPLRTIFEALDAKVSWDEQTQKIKATKKDIVITLIINNSTMTVNNITKTIDCPPCIIDGRTLVPVRAISEAFGISVQWKADTKTVVIDTEKQIENTDATVEKVTLYAPDGRTISVFDTEIEAYTNVGWYTVPVGIMYSIDGRTIIVSTAEMSAYQAVGWFTEPVVTVYSENGNSISILKSEIKTYEEKGWYTEPVQRLYTVESGKTIKSQLFKKSEVEKNLKLGWYATEQEAQQVINANIKQAFDKTVIVINALRKSFKDPSSFALRKAYGGFITPIYQSYDFAVVAQTSGKNSYGATVSNTYLIMVNTKTGDVIFDFIDYCETMKDRAWGTDKLKLYDVLTEAYNFTGRPSEKLTAFKVDKIMEQLN